MGQLGAAMQELAEARELSANLELLYEAVAAEDTGVQVALVYNGQSYALCDFQNLPLAAHTPLVEQLMQTRVALQDGIANHLQGMLQILQTHLHGPQDAAGAVPRAARS